jgi:hypothetical protein
MSLCPKSDRHGEDDLRAEYSGQPSHPLQLMRVQGTSVRGCTLRCARAILQSMEIG